MLRTTVTALVMAIGLTACDSESATALRPVEPSLALAPGGSNNSDGFQHGPDGAFDIPGHEWVVGGGNQLTGKHYNTGPFGAPQWRSSDAPDGGLLYIVHGTVDEWTPEKAAMYGERGYIHYHELITVSDGALHPSKVVWLRHTVRTRFTVDGGPHPELAHSVEPGVDLEFVPNGMTPYMP